jgi:hypothetical protein
MRAAQNVQTARFTQRRAIALVFLRSRHEFGHSKLHPTGGKISIARH